MPRLSFGPCFALPRLGKKRYTRKNNDVDVLEQRDLLELSPNDLELITDGFCPENCIGFAQFSVLFRAKMFLGLNQDQTIKDVAVKIWVVPGLPGEMTRLEDEVEFLQDPTNRGNPNLMKLIGCCRVPYRWALIYDVNPHDTLRNLITRDDFSWLQRIKVALALARMLNLLHDRKLFYQIRNFDPAHIVLDQDFNPILFEFGMLSGGVLSRKSSELESIAGSFGYIDPVVAVRGHEPPSVKPDVYAFGILLFNLMSKRVGEKYRSACVKKNLVDCVVHVWVAKEYKHGCSLVHPSLVDDPNFYPSDGPKITELAKQCIDCEQRKRPVMKEVIKRLRALIVVQQHGEACGAIDVLVAR